MADDGQRVLGLALLPEHAGSRLVAHPGMGHELPRAPWPAIADDVRGTADLAAARRAERGAAG
ncbi:hypothetical protein [Geodermatophilus sp. SYSU D01036]